jgi:hypothetical protein
MEVSGQLNVPAAFPSGKEPPIPVTKEAGWTPESHGFLWRNITIYLVFSGFNYRPNYPLASKRASVFLFMVFMLL